MSTCSRSKNIIQKTVFSTLASWMFISSSWACIDGQGLLPHGKQISIPTSYHNFLNPHAVTEEAFFKVTQDLEKLYQPIVQARGGVLEIVKNWKSNEANAFARRNGTTYNVSMFGGLARHPMNTIDGFTMVICHELGHHLAGKPLVSTWASTEGQSDYYASAKCMRKYLSTQDNAAVVATMIVPEKVQTHCFKSFGPSNDHALCIRSSLAGLALSNVLHSLTGGGGSGSGGGWGKSDRPSTPSVKPDFKTPDTSRVTTTATKHPKAQCRLDTYFAGAVCDVPATVDFSYTDEKTGACLSDISARPACWYAATN
jgi:hypothetical protein